MCVMAGAAKLGLTRAGDLFYIIENFVTEKKVFHLNPQNLLSLNSTWQKMAHEDTYNRAQLFSSKLINTQDN